MTGGRGAWGFLVLVVAVVEHRLQLDLLLLTGIDEQQLGADLEGEQLHLLVGERHRRRHHLAVVEQESHDVGRGAVQLGSELLRRHSAFDDDRAFWHGRVARRVRGVLRLQFVLVATTTAATAAARRTTLPAPDVHRDRRDHRGHRPDHPDDRRGRHRDRRDDHRDRHSGRRTHQDAPFHRRDVRRIRRCDRRGSWSGRQDHSGVHSVGRLPGAPPGRAAAGSVARSVKVAGRAAAGRDDPSAKSVGRAKRPEPGRRPSLDRRGQQGVAPRGRGRFGGRTWRAGRRSPARDHAALRGACWCRASKGGVELAFDDRRLGRFDFRLGNDRLGDDRRRRLGGDARLPVGRPCRRRWRRAGRRLDLGWRLCGCLGEGGCRFGVVGRFGRRGDRLDRRCRNRDDVFRFSHWLGLAGGGVSDTAVSVSATAAATGAVTTGSVSTAGSSAPDLAAASWLCLWAGAFFAALGSSGCSGRVRPSCTVRRRTMSA